MRLLRVFALFSVGSMVLAGPVSAAPPVQSPSAVSDPIMVSTASQTGLESFATSDLTSALQAHAADRERRVQRYGPYHSSSTDSGTCGADWANDTFDRIFWVIRRSATTYAVIEQFTNGRFVTFFGPSPGACDSSDGTPPGFVNAGVHGNLFGFFVISQTGVQTSTDGSCVAHVPNAPCTTAGFMGSHFAGPPYTIGTFYFRYWAHDQGLIYRQWINASCDIGGNHGDIQSFSAPVPFNVVADCPH